MSHREKQFPPPTKSPTSPNESKHKLASLASIFPDIRAAITNPFQNQLSKLSPFFQRKCGLRTKSDIELLTVECSNCTDESQVDTDLTPCAEVVPCCSVIVQDNGDDYATIPVCHVVDEDCTAVERSLPWRRSISCDSDHPALSHSPPVSSILEDLPELSREHILSVPPRCWSAGHHRHLHNSLHGYSGQHPAPEGSSLLHTPVSDSANGSSVESAMGEVHLAPTTTTNSASTHSTDCQMAVSSTDMATAPPWSRSNSHDLPTVQEEDVDELHGLLPRLVTPSLCLGRKQSSPFHHSDDAYSPSRRQAELCVDPTLSVGDRGIHSDLAVPSDLQSYNSLDDCPDGRVSQGQRWCLSDQCSAPQRSPMFRDVGFFDDNTCNSGVPSRAVPHYRGLHPKDAELRGPTHLHGPTENAAQLAGRRRRWSTTQVPSSRQLCCVAFDVETCSSNPDKVVLDVAGGTGDVFHTYEDRVLKWLQESGQHMPTEGKLEEEEDKLQ